VLVVDTGPLVATADRADKDHAACRALLEGDEGPLVTTALVIAEAVYLINRQLGPQAEASLYDSITSGQLEVASLGHDDWGAHPGAGHHLRRPPPVDMGPSPGLRLGGTDASMITLAERLGATRIATLNHRDFTVVRPRHAGAFELLP
jgi:uncharacterized protein